MENFEIFIVFLLIAFHIILRKISKVGTHEGL